MKADVVISISPLKTHELCGTTLTMKNVGVGIVPNNVYGNFKTGLAHNRMDKVIADICEIVGIDFAVISGIYGQQGQGPTRGDPVYHGLVICGKDCVAVDTIGSAVVGFNPVRLGYLKRGEEIGLGERENIDVRYVKRDGLGIIRRPIVEGGIEKGIYRLGVPVGWPFWPPPHVAQDVMKMYDEPPFHAPGAWCDVNGW
jgi:uncharacterized protein (DUF362 family)